MPIAPRPTTRHYRIRAALLRWYDKNKRDLPWRRNPDPYAIWVSETMLQQTQVATVIPYYLRFMKRFPNIAALERAPLESVLSLWSGLGYYRRAKNLKAAASVVVKEFGGRLPNDYKALTTLPGIGRYTAGALMSIAFGKPYSAVDGNARRVFYRLFGSSPESEVAQAAQCLVSQRRPGDSTQALMELGSTVCVPSAPACPRCPIAHWCSARRSGTLERMPRRNVPMTPVEWPLVFVEAGGFVLLHRRPREGLLAGLWELPQPHALTGEFADLRRAAKDQAPIAVIQHAITKHRITAPLYIVRTEIRRGAVSWIWVPFAELASQPLSSLSTKGIKAAREKLNL